MIPPKEDPIGMITQNAEQNYYEPDNRSRKQMKSNYYIVEFEDGMQVLPSNWLLSDEVALWPPITDWRKYYSIVKNKCEPLETWKETRIMKMIGSANTFSRAMEKLSMAENTSDISTDSDFNKSKLKRRQRSKRIISDDDDDEEQQLDLDRNDNIRKKLKVLPVPPKGTKNASIDVSSLLNSLKNLSVKKTYEPTCASSSSLPNKLTETIIEDPLIMHAEYNSSKSRREEKDKSSEKQCNLCSVIYELQRESIRLSIEMNLRLQKCEKMLQDITNKMNNQNSSVSDMIDIHCNDLECQYLPAQSVEDFHEAEAKLKNDKEYKKNITELLFRCKDRNLKSSIYTIMEKLMKNSIAMQYSWTGAKQKKEKFEISPFRKLIEAIIMQLHKDATLNDAKKCITDRL